MSSEVIKADLDEIVFDRRNKAYGAYVIRRLYPKNLSRSFAVAIFLAGLLISYPVIAQFLSEMTAVKKEGPNLSYAELKDPPPIDKETPPPPPPEEIPPPPKRSSIKFVPPEIVKDEEAPKDIKLVDQDSLKDKNPGLEDVKGDDNAPVDFGDDKGTGEVPVEIQEKPKVEEDPDINAFIAVEKDPQPVNLGDLKKLIGYPSSAREMGISGKVTIRILVNAEGKYEKHQVIRSPHQVLTDACVAQIKNLQFTPGIQGGKPIKCWVNVPFDFKLQ